MPLFKNLENPVAAELTGTANQVSVSIVSKINIGPVNYPSITTTHPRCDL